VSVGLRHPGRTFDAGQAAAAALFFGGVATLLALGVDSALAARRAAEAAALEKARIVLTLEELRPIRSAAFWSNKGSKRARRATRSPRFRPCTNHRPFGRAKT
jgi:hypothetical protein